MLLICCSKSSSNVQKNANELIPGHASRRKEEGWTEVNEDLTEGVKSNNLKWVKGHHSE